MKDLTENSISRHILQMAGPIAFGMIFQTLYFLVDLYFVGKIGNEAVAGVSGAGNVTAIVLALTQALGVGTLAMMAQAIGRKDYSEAKQIFRQSLLLALLFTGFTILLIFVLAGVYLHLVMATSETGAFGVTYLKWFAPGLGLQFVVTAITFALRSAGIVKPAMTIQMFTVIVNIILAPIFIVGLGTNYPMGVAGAGLASTVAISLGVILLLRHLVKEKGILTMEQFSWKPKFSLWRRILGIGLPAGAEFILIFISTAVMYWAIRGFGAAAQAGFGIGFRIMQGIFLPAMAIAFAAGPIAGQNYGAGRTARVVQTFISAAGISTAVMILITLLAQFHAETFVGIFTDDMDARKAGATFLRLVSWNFVAQGIVFVCSNIFQGLGNTRPAFLSSVIRLSAFAFPCIATAVQVGFYIEQVWYIAISAVVMQSILSVLLLQIEFQKKFMPVATV